MAGSKPKEIPLEVNAKISKEGDDKMDIPGIYADVLVLINELKTGLGVCRGALGKIHGGANTGTLVKSQAGTPRMCARRRILGCCFAAAMSSLRETATQTTWRTLTSGAAQAVTCFCWLEVRSARGINCCRLWPRQPWSSWQAHGVLRRRIGCGS
jgi:hypothetical protein